ncbi:hypothetical protein MKW94_014747, partial [Papaver nudicaule]|nr:hypothetical protein [Papaver nudicaule]
MTIGLRGLARMLSTAMNSTRKEGFSRMFSSSAAEKNLKPKGEYLSERMKEIYGDIDYRTLTPAQRQKIIDRQVTREVASLIMKGLSAGVAIGLAINFAFGLYPFHQK